MSPITDYLVEAGTTLLAVVMLGALVVFGTRKLAPHTGPLELIGQLPLGARRAVYLVRIGERVFVLGGSEAGLATLGEMPAQAVPPQAPPTGKSFQQIWRQIQSPARPAIDLGAFTPEAAPPPSAKDRV